MAAGFNQNIKLQQRQACWHLS